MRTVSALIYKDGFGGWSMDFATSTVKDGVSAFSFSRLV